MRLPPPVLPPPAAVSPAMSLLPEPRLVLFSHAQFVVARAFLFDGASNRTVAKRCFITEDTVKSHMKSIMRKVGVSDRTEAAVLVWSGEVDIVHLGSQRFDCRECGDRHLLRELWQLRDSRLASVVSAG